MVSRTFSFLVWALVAASAVFWGVKLMAQPMPVPPGAAVATVSTAQGGDLSALLGTKPPEPAVEVEATPPPPEGSRFQLIGVVAARHAARAQGVALIAVDGKAPRAYRVGAAVDGDLVLQSVQARAAALGPRGGAAAVSLELPPLPPPATGVPGATAGAGPVQPLAQPGLPPQALPMLQPGMPAPPQLAVPPQARLRSQRFGGAPPGGVVPGAAPVVQDAGQVNEAPPAPADNRNLR